MAMPYDSTRAAPRAILRIVLGACLFVAGHLAAQEPPHPILNISGSGSGADSVLNISESTYTNNFTPRQPPRNDGYGFVPEVVAGDNDWSWSASSPTQIVSLPSGIIFPN